MLYIPWMVILGDQNIKKVSFKNFDFSAPQGEKLHQQVVGRPVHKAIIGGNGHFVSLARVVTGSQQGYGPQETSFRILVGIYCHNIPTHTPWSGYHGVTEVAKPANIPKMAEKCIDYNSARPTPPHTNSMESGPGNTFLAQNKKKPKDS